jgi:predicted O-methyltransferase YrrM
MNALDTALIERTKGFLDEAEGRRLYELAREVSGRGPCLEIGSYCGKSSLYLGAGCRATGGLLFSIDHHRGSEEQQPGQAYCDTDLIDRRSGRIDTFGIFRSTLEQAGLEDTVVPIVCRSRTAARQWATPLSLVFIDGGHTFEAAFTDYNVWAGHILPGGYLLIHDIFFDPAQGGQAPRHIYELACRSGLFDDLGVVKTLAILRRRDGTRLPDDLPA